MDRIPPANPEQSTGREHYPFGRYWKFSGYGI